MKQGLYKGYSTHEHALTRTFSVTDVELVKLDILNHIFTRKGERVMMPRFGTRIPDLLFEPLDPITLDIIEEDLRAVISFDPRVELLELRIVPDYDMSSVTASARLLYIELNMQGNLDLNLTFDAS